MKNCNKVKTLSVVSILAVLLLSAHLPSVQSSATYHVTTTGDDSNDGSESLPWRTISRGVSNLKPGDTVVVHDGTYNEAVDIEASGADNAYIRIIGQGSVILNGEGVQRDGIVLRPGVSYLEIKGIHITGFLGSWGLALYGGNKHIVLRSIEVDHCDAGLRLTVGYSGQPADFGDTEDVTIEGAYIHHNRVGGLDCTPGPCRRLTVKNSEFAYNGAEAGFGADGVGIETGDHILIEHVRSHDNGGDGIDIGSRNPLTTEKGADVTAKECGVYGNGRNGLKLWTGGRVVNCVVHSNALSPLVIIYNADYEVVNTLVTMNSQEDRDYGMTAGYAQPEPLGKNNEIRLIIFNSIFAFNGPPGEPTGVYVGKGVKLLSDYNIWYSRPDEEIYLEAKEKSYSQSDIRDKVWFAETGNDEHSIVADPLFVNLAENNFDLSPNSPAVDKGTPAFQGMSAPSIDILGHKRPHGKYDIGPFERGSLEPSEEATRTFTSSQTTIATTTAKSTSETKLEETRGLDTSTLAVATTIVVVAAIGFAAFLRLRKPTPSQQPPSNTV